MRRPHPPRTRLESDIVEAEDAVDGLRRAQPRGHGDHAALLQRPRAGPAHHPHALLGLPAVPGILGFDPRYQFIHEDDIVGVLHHAVAQRPARHLQRAADGVLALSEVAGLLGKPYAPILPPWGSSWPRRR